MLGTEKKVNCWLYGKHSLLRVFVTRELLEAPELVARHTPAVGCVEVIALPLVGFVI